MEHKIFQAYSDESGINDGDPYTSVSVVSGEEIMLNCLRDKLAQEISTKRIKEVKFVKVTSHNSTIAQAAKTFINIAVNDFAAFTKIRIDTMTMDNQYLLSAFPNYDREQKLEHMYYCLLSHLGKQWNNAQWHFYPDKNSKVRWSRIISFLNQARLHRNKVGKPLLIKLMLQENPLFQFGEVKQLCSIQEPLVQLADLFAGLARFSHEENIDCSRWLPNPKTGRQSEMKLGENDKISGISPTKKCRYELIGELYNLCGKHSLWVSIRTKRHLWTRKQTSPINFWDYKKP